MLYETGKAVKAMIESLFTIVEFYEGQFENFDEQIVNPPMAYLDMSGGRAGIAGQAIGETEIKIYLMTSKATHDPGNMLDLVEDVITALHNKAVRYDVGEDANDPPAVYAGKCFCGEYRPLVTYPGLHVWELNAVVKLNEVNQ